MGMYPRINEIVGQDYTAQSPVDPKWFFGLHIAIELTKEADATALRKALAKGVEGHGEVLTILKKSYLEKRTDAPYPRANRFITAAFGG